MVERPLQDAVDDEVGIAADRRREVGVSGQTPREMTERIGGVSRLLERPQHQVGDNAFFGLPRFFRPGVVVLWRMAMSSAPGSATVIGRSRRRPGRPWRSRPLDGIVARPDRTVASGHFHASRLRAARKILDAQRVAKVCASSSNSRISFLGLAFRERGAIEPDAAALEVARDRLVGCPA